MHSASHIAALGPRRAIRSLLALFLASSLTIPCLSQADTEPAPDENATMTLHVYANLIQIPVLILGPYLDYAPAVDPKKLMVSLENGKPFHPVHVRPEGEDPITLAILLDSSQSQQESLDGLGNALAKLVGRSLRPHDSVAIYSLDCGVAPIADFTSPDSAQLKTAGKSASTYLSPRVNKNARDCGESHRLNDALVTVAARMQDRSGRRVILAITGTPDKNSQATEEDVRQAAVSFGVAIFGLSTYNHSGSTFNMVGGGGGGRQSRGRAMETLTPDPATSPFLEILCERTGGIARYASIDALPTALTLFIKTLRERTIIEFPRPKDIGSGRQTIHVHLGKGQYFIRSAGVSVPIADPRILADPTTVLPENSEATPTPPPPTPPL